MARLIRALAEIARATDARRSADKPSGALRAVSGYLIGLAILSTAANAWTFFSVFRGILSRADAYSVASLSTMIACAPLVASLTLSRGSTEPGQRLGLLPVDKPTRMALAALGPLTAELPIIAIASLLPAVAASPLAAFSAADYAFAVVGFITVSVALALTARSLGRLAGRHLLSCFLGRLGRRRRKRQQDHAAAARRSSAAIAASNPRTVIVEGRAALALFGSRLLPASLVDDQASPAWLACLALAALALAMAAAIVEDAARRRSVDRSRTGRRANGRLVAGVSSQVIMAVVDRDRIFVPSAAASTAFGIIAVAEGAPPAIPLVAAMAILAVRAGSAMGFMAVENSAARRFALIPAAPGAADRSYMRAALAMAAAIATPLLLSAAFLVLA